MKEILIKVKKTDLENTLLKMVQFLKVISKMIKLMVKVKLILLMVIVMKETC